MIGELKTKIYGCLNIHKEYGITNSAEYSDLVRKLYLREESIRDEIEASLYVEDYAKANFLHGQLSEVERILFELEHMINE